MEQRFPNEIIVKILRSNKQLHESSRILSKDIRNGSLNDILQYELLKPIIEQEKIPLYRENVNWSPFSIIETSSFCFFDDEGYSFNLTGYVEPKVENTKVEMYYGRSKNRYDHYDCKEKYLPEYQNFHPVSWDYRGTAEMEEYDSVVYYQSCEDEGDKVSHEYIYDVDFVSFYKLMLERLFCYDCDKRKIALSLTLSKFDKMVSDKCCVRVALYLYGTAIAASLDMSWKTTDWTYQEVIDILQEPVRDYLVNLK